MQPVQTGAAVSTQQDHHSRIHSGDEHTPPFLLAIAIASFIVMCAASVVCHDTSDCSKENGWAVAGSVISLVLAIVALFMEKFAQVASEQVMPPLSVFFLIWWAVLAGVCTFRAPFLTTGNGYFACWAAFFVSAAFAAERTAAIGSLVSRAHSASEIHSHAEKALIVVLVASVVEIVASSTLCDQLSDCTDERGWAVAAGVLGTVVALVAFIFHRFGFISELTEKIFAILLLLIWIPGCGVVTFSLNVFPYSGNGFFAAWIAFIASVFYAGLVFPVIGDALTSARFGFTGRRGSDAQPVSQQPAAAQQHVAPPYITSGAPPATAYPPPPPAPTSGSYLPSAYPPPTYPPSSGGYQ